MSILYIGSNEVCLTNNSFSKIIYKANKEKIDYNLLIKLLKKEKKIFIFIKSFFAFTEHKTFQLGMSKKDMQATIDKRLSQNDVVCASYNHLFAKGNGAEHSNDVIITIIKESDEEKHIKKLINELAKTDLDLSHFYSFDQAINTIGMSYSSLLNRNINVNVIVLEKDAMIMVSNTTHYMFGRLIKQRENEDLQTTVAKMLSTTLKYISTTYSFLHNEIKITISSQQRVDVDMIKSVDSVFDGIKIITQTLKMPNIKISKEVPTITAELQLIKLSFDNLKKVNLLTNNKLQDHIKAHKIILILQFISISLFIFVAVYGTIKYISGTKLSYNDSKIDRQYDAVVQQTEFEEKKIAQYDNNVYAILAKETKKNIAEDDNLKILKEISTVFNKHRNLIFIEGYKYSCEDCIQKNKKNTLQIDIALFNVNSSIKFAMKKLSELEADLKKLLEKKYKFVDILFQQTSKEKRLLATRDVRDTIIIKFSND